MAKALMVWLISTINTQMRDKFRTFCPGLEFGKRYDVDHHGHLALLSVLNEMHTNSYSLDCY